VAHCIVVKEVCEKNQQIGAGRECGRVPLMAGDASADVSGHPNAKGFKNLGNVSQTVSTNEDSIHC
jgi:hypothetical protein